MNLFKNCIFCNSKNVVTQNETDLLHPTYKWRMNIFIHLLDSMLKWCKFILKFNYDLYSLKIPMLFLILYLPFFTWRNFIVTITRWYFLKNRVSSVSLWKSGKGYHQFLRNCGEIRKNYGMRKKYFHGTFLIFKYYFSSWFIFIYEQNSQ